MLETLKIAVPVALSYLGIIAMSLVDLYFADQFGASAVAGMGAGNSAFVLVFAAILSLVVSLEFYCSEAFSRTGLIEVKKWWVHGLWMSVLVFVPCLFLYYLSPLLFLATGTQPEASAFGVRYLNICQYSVVFIFIFHANRIYLQVLRKEWWVLGILLVANLLNYGLIEYLKKIYGFDGIAYATVWSRAFLAAASLVAALVLSRHEKIPVRNWFPAREKLSAMVKLGAPAMVQILLEAGFFGMTTLFAVRFLSQEAAAHQIALHTASTTFLVVLGLSSAAAVMIGKAHGLRDQKRVNELGNQFLKMTVIWMGFFAVVFLLFPEVFLRIFTKDPEIIRHGVPLMRIMGLFQVFDGLQCVLSGMFRGMARTFYPAWANFFGYVWIGFPLICWLVFRTEWRVVGIWIGMFTGLFSVSLPLLYIWFKKGRRLDLPEEGPLVVGGPG